MKLIDPIVKNIKKYKKSDFFKAKFIFTKFYERSTLREDFILIQSYDGSSISGNPYYILLELCQNPRYSRFRKFVVANRGNYNSISTLIKEKELENVQVVLIHSKLYCRLLAESKYLINNSTFPSYFIKRKGQIYLNTWHGTPLKCMGKNIIDSPHELGNTQRNFMMSDYLLYPNKFTFEKMKSAYMLDTLYKGKYVISGYPRNSIFFNAERRNEIKDKLELAEKKVIVYMPTWRGTARAKNNEEQYVNIMYMLYKLEESLDENTIVYLKIHNLASAKIKYKSFTKIKPFPKGYETYDFLNIADCLITDYSSVMFDFVNTGKKIVLYTYDYKKYTENRGFYINIKGLPLTIVDNAIDLCKELNKIEEYEEYTSLKKKYCNYDSINASKDICRLVFDGKKSNNMEIIDGKSFDNNKKRVLIFTGALLKNGITTSLKGLINNINLTDMNYYLTFYRNPVDKNKYIINEFPEKINYIPIQGQKSISISEAIAQYLYFRLNLNTKYIKRKLSDLYKREISRIYPQIKFDYVIDFCGYDKHPINMFGYMKAKRIRFTHSTMQAEQKMRNNLHIPSIKFAYNVYDEIVGVREGMEEEISSLFNDVKPKKISIVHNINNIDAIMENAKKELEFENNTYSNYEINAINAILNDDENIKFINIARFSKEKGLDRLILAFAEFNKKYPNSYLFLVGGHGLEFNKLMNITKENNVKNIIFIKNIINPFPILSKCNLFILSSYYEGLPMTIMESLILGVPVLSTDIEGPRKFLSQGYAHLVENSQEGLLKGMNLFYETRFKDLKTFDAKKFNEVALDEFYKLFREEKEENK